MAVHPPLSVLSLCSGIGGLDLGLHLACHQAVTRCYVEIEVTAAQVLVARMEDGTLDPAPVWSNLKTFDGRSWRGGIDVVVAGYPCQPFSCAGKQRGTDDPRHLWPHVARIIGEVQPAIVFLENVENHLRIGYEQVRGELRGLGYEVEEAIFTAEEVGAPHLRKRLFILAHGTGRGCGILRESPRGDGLADGCGEELDDAKLLQGRQQSGNRPSTRTQVSGNNMADAKPARLGRSTRQRLQPDGPALETARSCDCYRQLADPERLPDDTPRKPGIETEAGLGRRQPSRGCPLFPPGPSDLDAWRELLHLDPTLEPAICGNADGLPPGLDGHKPPPRTDRLRGVGNAVCPLTAAFAYTVLSERLLARLDHPPGVGQFLATLASP